MPDCYLCGDYIGRGRGYRREVQVESSTRVYISRRPGSSFGTRTALRTVCRRCAKVEDKVASGRWLRQLGYVAGFGASVWFGWQVVMHSEGPALWVGLLFLLGLPVPIFAWMIEFMVHSLAEDDVPKALSTLDLSHTPRPPVRPVTGSQTKVLGGAPAAGDTGPDLLDQASFQAGDTIDAWTVRAEKACRILLPEDPDFNEEAFLALAWHAKPRRGEPLGDYMVRAAARREELESSLLSDCTPRRSNEAFANYVARAGPHLIYYTPGLSLDDICPALVDLAKSAPANADETDMDWINRMLPRVIKLVLSMQ